MARRNDLEFRREEVGQIYQCWQNGLSCSVVGVGSAGKTNLLQHLLDKDVQANTFGRNSSSILPIMIDSNVLSPLPQRASGSEAITATEVQHRCWAGFELMLHRVVLSILNAHDMTREQTDRLYDIYHAAQDGLNATVYLRSLRHLEDALNIALNSTATSLRLIFLLDEFDELIRQMPPLFLQSLRGLRDRFKGRLSYTAFTRSPLPALTRQYANPLAVESFTELFTDNTLYLAGYNGRDALAMLNTLNARRQSAYPPTTLQGMVELTGGFAGLLRAVFQTYDVISEADPQRLATRLIAQPNVRAECLAIWRGLTQNEQQIVLATARQTYYAVNVATEDAIGTLIQKHLLRLQIEAGKQQLRIIPPLFRLFVEQRLYDGQ